VNSNVHLFYFKYIEINLIMQYKFKYQKDGITFVYNNDKIIAKYKLDYRWKEVNYSYKDNYIQIRIFNGIKKYQDVLIELNKEEIQEIP